MDEGGLAINDGHEERLAVGSADKGDAALAGLERQRPVGRNGGREPSVAAVDEEPVGAVRRVGGEPANGCGRFGFGADAG
jgi:hypothetical protein